MAEKTLITKSELAKRWQVSPNHISQLEEQGLLVRTKVGRCTYPLSMVYRLEMADRPDLQETNEKLMQDLQELKEENEILRKIVRRLSG